MSWALFAAALLVATQSTEPPPPRTTIQSDGDPGRYEVMYGKPEFWSLELLRSEGVPRNQSIRTVGLFSVAMRPHPEPPQGQICVEELFCLPLANPVPEISDAFFIDSWSRKGHEMEVVGAFTEKGFIFWSFVSGPPRKKAADSGGLPLENLVRQPDRYQGRTIVVRGFFRGRNLFGDMPAASGKGKSDWVLRDGPFFVWVTGKRPKGDGFALDLDRPSDATYRLEVEGRPELENGIVYLKAEAVRLLGRTAEKDPPD